MLPQLLAKKKHYYITSPFRESFFTCEFHFLKKDSLAGIFHDLSHMPLTQIYSRYVVAPSLCFRSSIGMSLFYLIRISLILTCIYRILFTKYETEMKMEGGNNKNEPKRHKCVLFFSFVFYKLVLSIVFRS